MFNYLICFYIRQQLRIVRMRAIARHAICRRTIDRAMARVSPGGRSKLRRLAKRVARGERHTRDEDARRRASGQKKIFVISVSGSKKIGSRRLRPEKNRAARVAN
jgi:hypothetical protein